MPDNQAYMANGSNHVAERNSVADAEMKLSEFTFIFRPVGTLSYSNGGGGPFGHLLTSKAFPFWRPWRFVWLVQRLGPGLFATSAAQIH